MTNYSEVAPDQKGRKIYNCISRVKDRHCGKKQTDESCFGCSDMILKRVKYIFITRDYEYTCIECKNSSPPVNSKNEEILVKKCYKRSKHESGTMVNMILTKLNEPKRFKFDVIQ